MTPLAPPWCLHWGKDGELAPSDRQALLQCLQRQDGQWARLMLTQAMHGAGPGAGPQVLPEHSVFPL
jgi:hypothetical protein